MKAKKRIRHACHNEEVCKLINANGKFPDWVITTAFYSAIHFVSFRIFPIIVENEGGHQDQLTTLDEYHRYHGFKFSKHQALSDLVYMRYPNISPDFDWLMDLCMTARYQNYQQVQEDATRALKLLDTIKAELGITNDIKD